MPIHAASPAMRMAIPEPTASASVRSKPDLGTGVDCESAMFTTVLLAVMKEGLALRQQKCLRLAGLKLAKSLRSANQARPARDCVEPRIVADAVQVRQVWEKQNDRIVLPHSHF